MKGYDDSRVDYVFMNCRAFSTEACVGNEVPDARAFDPLGFLPSIFRRIGISRLIRP